jgi:hypothetical protein
MRCPRNTGAGHDRVIVTNFSRTLRYQRAEIQSLSSIALDWTFKPTDVLALVVRDAKTGKVSRVPVMCTGRFSQATRVRIVETLSEVAPTDNRVASYTEWH